jgi:hypothetical protein
MYYFEKTYKETLRSQHFKVISLPYLHLFIHLIFTLYSVSEKEAKTVDLHVS